MAQPAYPIPFASPIIGSQPTNLLEIETQLVKLESQMQQQGFDFSSTTSLVVNLSKRINAALAVLVDNWAKITEEIIETALVLVKATWLTDLFTSLPQEMQFYSLLAERSNNCSFAGNFDPFLVNNHPYYAYGPYWTIEEAPNQEEAIKNYITEIKKFDLVINLIEKDQFDDPSYYSKHSSFKNLYLFDEEKSSKDYAHYDKKYSTNQLIHIHSWTDGGVPTQVSACFEVAVKVERAQRSGKTVFVHCMAGLQRTPTFIVMCELLMHADTVVQMPNDRIRAFIKLMILQMTTTVQIRYPTIIQLKFLFSDSFIESAKETCSQFLIGSIHFT